MASLIGKWELEDREESIILLKYMVPFPIDNFKSKIGHKISAFKSQ